MENGSWKTAGGGNSPACPAISSTIVSAILSAIASAASAEASAAVEAPAADPSSAALTEEKAEADSAFAVRTRDLSQFKPKKIYAPQPKATPDN